MVDTRVVVSRQVKISRWDASEFLESQEDIDAYLEVAFETGDPRQITKALGNVARAQGHEGNSQQNRA